MHAEPGYKGIREMHLVNHSATPPEFAVSVSVLADVETQERRAGMSGTQALDGHWARLEANIPKTLSGVQTHSGRANYVEHIRFSQWLLMLSTADKWGAFCQAAQRFDESGGTDKVKMTLPKRRVITTQPRQDGDGDGGGEENELCEVQSVKRFEDTELTEGNLGGKASKRHRADGPMEPAGGIVDDCQLPAASPVLEESHNLVDGGDGEDSVECVEPLVEVQGAELLDDPNIHLSDALGCTFTLASFDEDRPQPRGCDNLLGTHCYANSVLQALSSLWQVRSWCAHHQEG